MTGKDVQLAAKKSGVQDYWLCNALRTVLPVLRTLADAVPPWKIWLKLGVKALVKALEQFEGMACDDEDGWTLGV